MSTSPFHIVFAIYPDVTQLDFTGPHQVLSQVPGTTVTVASAPGGNIAAEGGLIFAQTARLADIAACDMLCVPGGRGTIEAINDPGFMADVARLGADARYVTSVCTGSLILGAAGLLAGKRVACHWAWRDLLPSFGAIPDPGRVVRDGRIITGGGVTAGIDFALTVAAELAGETVAQAIQLGIEYAPAPPFNAGRPETAPPAVLALVEDMMAALKYPRQAQAQAAQAARG
ncbi:DJ-1/PfpI family protein [Oleomonas cavernae]|uniref:DJ-1/PfpI family protein n=1 Tax=Oleomonas cavernae TaxID=2320859 RepID=A0A418WE54_9PROT|nr:DJ-1/PfpI family protein [Oleomonas cavernae]RJF88219.1 DJ-1/PfpI family protein [Oleomonas cavernae]